MKINIAGEKKELERLGTAFVYRTPSQTRPGLFHYVTVFTGDDAGRGMLCSCEGFSYNKHCWHILSVPLCLAKEPVVKGKLVAVRECGYVEGHGGRHTWEREGRHAKPEKVESQTSQE